MFALKGKFGFLISKICSFMNSIWFAGLLAIIEIICYYLGLDLIIIAIVSLSITFNYLFNHKLNSILVIFLFMSSMISLKNTPSSNDSFNNYYFRIEIITLCIIFVSIPVSTVIARFIFNIIRKNIKFDSLFCFTILFGVTLITNGLLTDKYDVLNTVFGIFMFFFFVVLLYASMPSFEINKDSMLGISRQVSFYLLVLILEVLVYYIKFLFSGGVIDDRLDIFLGWGNRNTLGMLFTVLIPFVFYLLKNEENKKISIFANTVFGLTLLAIIFSFSRQSYLFLFLLITSYLLILIFKSKKEEKTKNVFFLSTWICSIILVLILGEKSGFFDSFGINFIAYTRIYLWIDAIESFNKFPIFGSGFFFLGGDPAVKLNSIMPYCCHNTIFEIMGACGFFGLLTYVLYRIIGIRKIIKNLTDEKAYIFASCSLIVLMSLLDIHLFDFFGSAVYSVLLGMCLSNKQTNLENNDKIVNGFELAIR